MKQLLFMRLYIRLSKNRSVIPFNYQHLLTGCVHKWIGDNNEVHGNRSLYCFSWLQNTRTNSNGLNLSRDSYFFISAYDVELIKRITKGVLADSNAFCGTKVLDLQVVDAPNFTNEERFILNSPVLLRKNEGNQTKHVTYKDPEFDELLTINAKSKLRRANKVDEGLILEWDKTYPSPKTKLVTYKGIGNKATLAPIIVKGTPEQIAFLWTVGLGESTGIGFGSIK